MFHIRIVPFALTRLNRLSADGVQNMDVKPAIRGLQGQILQKEYVTRLKPIFQYAEQKISDICLQIFLE